MNRRGNGWAITLIILTIISTIIAIISLYLQIRSGQ